jgi:D-glycero-D-manno-heptose 1,7-bisphosphate phosphatase
MKPCLFLDRDGIVIENVPYSNDPGAVVLFKGITSLISRARQLGFLVICVTNQSGIGRGWVTLEAYHAITARMLELLGAEGCRFDAIYYAPYFEKAQDPRWLENPEWRKPGAGMLEQACLDFQIELAKSVIVGDRCSDVEAGFRAGVPRRILVASADFPDEIKAVPPGIEFQVVQSLDEINM